MYFTSTRLVNYTQTIGLDIIIVMNIVDNVARLSETHRNTKEIESNDDKSDTWIIKEPKISHEVNYCKRKNVKSNIYYFIIHVLFLSNMICVTNIHFISCIIFSIQRKPMQQRQQC